MEKAETHRAGEAAGPDRTRRATLGALGVLGALGPAALLGCGGGEEDAASASSAASGSDTSTGSGTTTTTTTSGTCTTIAEETAGPYPADGSNTNSGSTVNVLTSTGIVRSDIRANIDGTNTRSGLPLTLTISLVGSRNGCAALAGYAIYIWHCDINGEYSAYSVSNNGSHSGESYLRGVQVTDNAGQVSFTTIYPGCYVPRAPHIHVEVYPNASAITSSANKVATSQFAFPDAVSTAVYATSAYASAGNATRRGSVTNANDQVFSDGTSTEMLTLSGDATSGYAATITVPVAV
ncbi:intradiol ring-cleavage dioxygenase [Cupriavidus necator]|uniref:intradiol ring-cleavage dioxygenase n=1 Tax=Cupriavidus necator TaxID=106590 RepID=UPI0039C2EDB3